MTSTQLRLLAAFLVLLCAGPDLRASDLFERQSGAHPRVRREALAAASGETLRLNAQADVSCEGRVTAASRTAFGSRVIRGTIPGQPGGAFLAVEHGSATAAAVWISPTARYALDGPAMRVLRGPSTARCAREAEPSPLQTTAPVRRSVSLPPPSSATVTGPLSFDVLVVYTPAALRAAGSADAVAAQAELAMADANACYVNSGIPIEGRIVGVRPVDYVESGEIRTDIRRLYTLDDGYLDDVAAMRDETEADLVCLFTDRASADGYEGFAEITSELKPNYESLGYSVVNLKSATVDHLFAHELGHNMGCDHDRANTTGLRLFDFSYGWRFIAGNGKLYRDIMAYAPGESIPYFANPLVSFLGTPTGVADFADTARTITACAPTFVNFRPADGRSLVAVRAKRPQVSADALGNAQASLQFERTGSVAQPLTVSYRLENAVAAPGGPPAPTQPITFPAGRHFVPLKLRVPVPDLPFGALNLTMAIQPGDGYAVADDPGTGASASATVTVLDRLPLVILRAGSLNKQGSKIKFPVSRIGPMDTALTVRYTVSGDAQAGVDYEPPDGALELAPSQTAGAVKIRLLPGGNVGRTLTVQITADPAYNVGSGRVDFPL